MKTFTKAAVLVVAAWIAVSAYGQNIPLTAKIHQSEQVFVNGQLVRMHTREGVFLRTSSGMILKRWTLIDGKQPTGEPGYGVLSDTQKGEIYSLDYARQTAYLHPSFGVPQSANSQKSPPNSALKVQEKGSVEGLSCTYNPAYVHTKTGETLNAGRVCRSDTYGIDLSQEVTFPAPSNPAQYSKVIEQLSDIQVGSEPDPKFFDLHSFTIYRPDGTN
ncbi:MAG: hypothetical protein WBE88_03030 [Candidatus Acidiferrales bacterium]